MSVWQFFACLNGYIEMNTPENKKKMSTDEAEELFDWLYDGLDLAEERIAYVYFWDENGFTLDETIPFTTSH